jgi:iron(III) transport system ATP-binding protein
LAQIRITIENVAVRFGTTTALGGVSLDVEPGELLLLLGPSGCGKSTLLRSVAGFVRPDQGVVRFDGEDITALPPDQRQIGMVFQSFALFPHLSVAENVAFGLRERRVDKREIPQRVDQALADMRLDGYQKRRVHELSGGEQQRVALARALVTRPRCLLLDEPLSNLDASLRQSMREEIRRVCKEYGLTTLYVTHDQKEALAIADRIAVMKKGYLEQVGLPHEVYRRPATSTVAQFLGETNLLECQVRTATDGAFSLARGQLQLPIEGIGAADVGKTVLASVRPECVRLASRASAEEPLEARVVSSVFLGELCEVTLDCRGELLRAFRLNCRPGDFEAGGQVFVGVSPSDVVLLQRGSGT